MYKFKTEPYEHQKDALKKCWNKEAFAVFAEMGTGKTKIALDNACILYNRGKIDRLLVVAPKGAYMTWFDQEIPTHVPDYIEKKGVIWKQSTSQKYKAQLKDIIKGKDYRLKIMVMNVESFSYPAAFSPAAYGFETSLDHDVRFWVYWLFQGKFFRVFALLFGVGFDIFLSNLEKRGLGLQSIDVYGRRLLWLFVFGVVHSIFLWTGDILHHYAICGLLLIPLRSFSQKGILLSILLLSLVLFYNVLVMT